MGAKASMVLRSVGDTAAALRRAADTPSEGAADLVRELFPDHSGTLEPSGATSLATGGNPPGGVIHAARFPGLEILCAKELTVEGSRMPSRMVSAGRGHRTVALAVHSAMDLLAFALWEDTRMVRSLCLAPDDGIMEDLGEPLPFEEPFWKGLHPVPGDGYPLPFHPLELAERAAQELLGFWYEGYPPPDGFEPEQVPLEVFRHRG